MSQSYPHLAAYVAAAWTGGFAIFHHLIQDHRVFAVPAHEAECLSELKQILRLSEDVEWWRWWCKCLLAALLGFLLVIIAAAAWCLVGAGGAACCLRRSVARSSVQLRGLTSEEEKHYREVVLRRRS